MGTHGVGKIHLRRKEVGVFLNMFEMIKTLMLKHDKEILDSPERQSSFFFFFFPQAPFFQSYLGQKNAVLKPISMF